MGFIITGWLIHLIDIGIIGSSTMLPSGKGIVTAVVDNTIDVFAFFMIGFCIMMLVDRKGGVPKIISYFVKGVRYSSFSVLISDNLRFFVSFDILAIFYFAHMCF
jgi:hypothetical protein